MAWSYLNPTAEQQWAWDSAYRCAFCGSSPSMDDLANGRCYCRDCHSCTSHWKADVVADMDEGRPHREDCPDCVAAASRCYYCDREAVTELKRGPLKGQRLCEVCNDDFEKGRRLQEAYDDYMCREATPEPIEDPVTTPIPVRVDGVSHASLREARKVRL